MPLTGRVYLGVADLAFLAQELGDVRAASNVLDHIDLVAHGAQSLDRNPFSKKDLIWIP